MEALYLMGGVLLLVAVSCWACWDNLCKDKNASMESKRLREERRGKRGVLFFRYVLRDRPPQTRSERKEDAAAALVSLRARKTPESKLYFYPKLIEISDPTAPQIKNVLAPPSILELRADIERAKFTGKGDLDVVVGMLDDFDSLMSGRMTRKEREKRFGWMGRLMATVDALARRAMSLLLNLEPTAAKYVPKKLSNRGCIRRLCRVMKRKSSQVAVTQVAPSATSLGASQSSDKPPKAPAHKRTERP